LIGAREFQTGGVNLRIAPAPGRGKGWFVPRAVGFAIGKKGNRGKGVREVTREKLNRKGIQLLTIRGDRQKKASRKGKASARNIIRLRGTKLAPKGP